MPIRPILLTLLATLCAASFAQEADLILRCNGSIETFGSKFPRSTKQDFFELKVNTSSGAISGGFAELIANADNFAPHVTEAEISATAVGKTLLPKTFLMPGAYYSLSRFTGTYALKTTLHFTDSNDFSETTVKATCEQAKRKF
jgi:hypothetical protein